MRTSAGRTVVGLLGEQGIETTVVEMNYTTVRRLQTMGVRAIHGDGSRPEVLEAAGIGKAAHLIVTAGEPRAVIDAARAIDPEVRVIARTSYASEAPALKRAGAETVVTAEVEVGFAMVERLLETLGASPDQVDRARERVRQEIAPTSS